MAYDDMLYEMKNQVAWITINRPDQGNTFRRQTVARADPCPQRGAERRRTSAWSCSPGPGDRFFCIGGEKEPNDGMLHYHNVPPVVDLYQLIDMMPVPVIAMVNGFAVGGGNVLANMCDLTVASDQATFRQVGPDDGLLRRGLRHLVPGGLGGPQAREGDLVPEPEVLGAARPGAWASSTRWCRTPSCAQRTEAMCEELKQRGPQALAALKAAFHARHNGAPGSRRVSHRPPRGELLPHRRGQGDGPRLQRQGAGRTPRSSTADEVAARASRSGSPTS